VPTAFQGENAPISYTITNEISVPLDRLTQLNQLKQFPTPDTLEAGHLLYIKWKCWFKPILGTDVLETSKTNVKYFRVTKDVERRS